MRDVSGGRLFNGNPFGNVGVVGDEENVGTKEFR